MKNTRSLGKKVLCLLLCCVMLNCTAFAAKPAEVHQFDEATIIFGGDSSPAKGRAMDEDIATIPIRCSHSWVVIPPVSACIDEGQSMSASVYNCGDTKIEVKCTIRLPDEGIAVDKTGVVDPSDSFEAKAISQKDGLNCTMDIQVRTYNAGETGIADITVSKHT